MKKNLIFIILGTLFCFNILAWIGLWQVNQPYLEVTFFDVGQGDAIFIETPQGHQILIDSGPGSAVLEKLGTEMPFYDRTIDLIVLTHPEYDHYSGFIEVLKRYKVENILWTGVLRNTAEFREWQKLIEEEKANIYIAWSGQKIKCLKPSFKQFSLDILFPFESLEGLEVNGANNTSVVTRLTYGNNSFLFTGDISKKIERELVDKGIDSDVLKVSHHGSKTSSAQEFIKEVSPEIAVIQCGKDNKYGHPSQETLDILEKYGINILRTDLDGDIKIISNGEDYVPSF